MKNPDEHAALEKIPLVTLGRRLRQAREACGLSVEAASEASGVKAAMIGRYERAEPEAGALKLAALASAYEVCCNWLLGQSPEMESLSDAHAVADLDLIEKIDAAKDEFEIRRLVCWDPAPFLAVVGIPRRHKVISAHQASVIGARIYERLKEIAPRVHKQWQKSFAIGGI